MLVAAALPKYLLNAKWKFANVNALLLANIVAEFWWTLPPKKLITKTRKSIKREGCQWQPSLFIQYSSFIQELLLCQFNYRFLSSGLYFYNIQSIACIVHLQRQSIATSHHLKYTGMHLLHIGIIHRYLRLSTIYAF